MGTPRTAAVLPREFYQLAASMVAPSLLGHLLVRRFPEGTCSAIIVETEAYLRDDAASHAAPGLTPRNRVMFGPPGHAYVYFIYGCHYCVNAVCQPAGTGEAVLIRAVEPVSGEGIMAQHRKARSRLGLTNGPGKLCQAMRIDKTLNGVDLCDPNSPLVIETNDELTKYTRKMGPVISSPRIGITLAADLPLRFYLQQSPFVSRKQTHIR